MNEGTEERQKKRNKQTNKERKKKRNKETNTQKINEDHKIEKIEKQRNRQMPNVHRINHASLGIRIAKRADLREDDCRVLP